MFIVGVGIVGVIILFYIFLLVSAQIQRKMNMKRLPILEIQEMEIRTEKELFERELEQEFDHIFHIEEFDQELFNNVKFSKKKVSSKYGTYVCITEKYIKKEIDELEKFCPCRYCNHNPFDQSNRWIMKVLYDITVPGLVVPYTFGCILARGTETHRPDLIRNARRRRNKKEREEVKKKKKK